ncbi:Aldehyde/histidinol dehydrogenase [Naviculisporaceae sp. PSN 640]
MAAIQKTLFSLSASRNIARSQFQRSNLPRILPSQSPSSAYWRFASTMAPKLKDPSLFKQDVCYVNGEWVKAKSGKTFEVKDPATGEFIGSSPEFDAHDTKLAINAAEAAFEPFRKLTGRERSKLLRKWYDLMVENHEDLATLVTWENGKPIADARGEITYAANFFEWFSEEAPRVYGNTIASSVPGNRVWTIKEPVGVCGLITPWNFPAAMITRKIGPALAAGCTVVCKSPGETPFTSLAIAELAHRAGIPKGVVNIITALDNTPEVGEVLTTDPVIRKISFTGSTPVGKLLMKQCSGTLKKLSLELGGNAPFIVFDDADVDLAVSGAIASKFRSSGQTCVCANRIFVQKGIYDEFSQKFAAKVKEFKVGNGFEKGITHGPLIHHRAIDKADHHVRDAEKKGAKIIVGGQKMPELGENFFQPTVLTGMTQEMAMASEETFGPVAGLFPFETEDEVVKLANSTVVGLAGYFFSRDLARVHRVAEHLEVGMVGVNTGIISDPAAPFGGVKESGFGREGSLYGIGEYQVTKMVTYGGMGLPLQK